MELFPLEEYNLSIYLISYLFPYTLKIILKPKDFNRLIKYYHKNNILNISKNLPKKDPIFFN